MMTLLGVSVDDPDPVATVGGGDALALARDLAVVRRISPLSVLDQRVTRDRSMTQ